MSCNLHSEAADTPPFLRLQISPKRVARTNPNRIHVPHLDEESDAAEKVGPKPIHPNRILITQETFDTRRVQNALEKEGVLQVTETTDNHKGFVFGSDGGGCHPECKSIGIQAGIKEEDPSREAIRL